MQESTIDQHVQELHSELLTLDSHIDINVANFTKEVNYTQNLDTQFNLPKMKQGGLDVAWLIVFTGQGELNEAAYKNARKVALSKFDAIDRLCMEYAPEQVELATSSSEVKRILEKGKKVIMIGVENAYPLGTDLKQLEDYHQRGARYISMSHNGHNQLCDSNTGEEDDIWIHGGLSGLGREALAEMNRLGIMADVSHVSRETMMQMVQLSEAPIIASHSSARALCGHSRNLDDEQLQALKEKGGLVQAVAFSSYLHTEKHNTRAAFMKQYLKRAASELGLPYFDRSQFSRLLKEDFVAFMNSRFRIQTLANALAAEDKQAPAQVNVQDFADHVDYLVDKMGIDQVGLSSDFDGGGGIAGWQDSSETINVTRELVKRGYDKEALTKLWGANMLRILDEVESYAASR
jgi:membrane dipeptidase